MARYRKVEEKVLTKWEYNGDEDNEELSFYANEIITVKDKLIGQPDYEGWWLGEIDGIQGYFPVSYVELIEPEKPAEPTPKVSQAKTSDRIKEMQKALNQQGFLCQGADVAETLAMNEKLQQSLAIASETEESHTEHVATVTRPARNDAEIENLQKELDAAKRELDASKKDLDVSRKELDAARKEALELKKKTEKEKSETVSTDSGALQAKVKEFEEYKKETQKSLASLKDEKDEIAARSTEAETQIKQLKDLLSETDTAKKELAEKDERNRKTIAEKEDKIQKITKEFQERKEELEKLTKDSIEKEAEIERYKSVIAIHEEKEASAEETTETKLQKLNADLHQEISKLRVELKLKENNNQDRKKEIADLNMEILEFVNSQKIQEDKLTLLRSEKQKRETEFEAEIAKKVEESKAQAAKYSELEDEMTKLKEKIADDAHKKKEKKGPKKEGQSGTEDATDETKKSKKPSLLDSSNPSIDVDGLAGATEATPSKARQGHKMSRRKSESRNSRDLTEEKNQQQKATEELQALNDQMKEVSDKLELVTKQLEQERTNNKNMIASIQEKNQNYAKLAGEFQAYQDKINTKKEKKGWFGGNQELTDLREELKTLEANNKKLQADCQCMVNLNRDLIMQMTNITQQQRKATLVPISRPPQGGPPPLMNKPPPPSILNKPPPKRVNIQTNDAANTKPAEEAKPNAVKFENEPAPTDQNPDGKLTRKKSHKRLSLSLKDKEI